MYLTNPSEYKRFHTEKYEGAYTAKEVELNNKLYDECLKEELNCDAIEKLLLQGADPLGATAVSGWGLLEHIYGEIVCDLQDDSSNLPKITELFLKHGMNIEKPRVPYDNNNSIHPMWDFAFLTDENAICTLEMLLNRGLSADAAGEMWGHLRDDLINVDCENPNDGEHGTKVCTFAVRYMLFCASYDHVINNDEKLQKAIGYSYNSYDIHKFRNWNDYRYEFDTSHCVNYPEFYKSVVTVFEKATNTEVWKFGICLDKDEL